MDDVRETVLLAKVAYRHIMIMWPTNDQVQLVQPQALQHMVIIKY